MAGEIVGATRPALRWHSRRTDLLAAPVDGSRVGCDIAPSDRRHRLRAVSCGIGRQIELAEASNYRRLLPKREAG
jgi:hypothetical protein